MLSILKPTDHPCVPKFNGSRKPNARKPCSGLPDACKMLGSWSPVWPACCNVLVLFLKLNIRKSCSGLPHAGQDTQKNYCLFLLCSLHWTLNWRYCIVEEFLAGKRDWNSCLVLPSFRSCLAVDRLAVGRTKKSNIAECKTMTPWHIDIERCSVLCKAYSIERCERQSQIYYRVQVSCPLETLLSTWLLVLKNGGRLKKRSGDVAWREFFGIRRCFRNLVNSYQSMILLTWDIHVRKWNVLLIRFAMLLLVAIVA